LAKEIIVSCNPVVNLLLHVICCADESFPRSPVYAQKASEWLKRDEKRFFENNFTMEQTGKVSTTQSFAFLFQVPAYFSEDTIESLRQALELMKTSLANMKQQFPEKQKMLSCYMPERTQNEFFGQAFEKRRNREELLDDYYRILQSVYRRFYNALWQE
jgi:hypothetical protein